LRPRYIGPYKFIKRLNPIAYRLDLLITQICVQRAPYLTTWAVHFRSWPCSLNQTHCGQWGSTVWRAPSQGTLGKYV